MLGNMRTYRAQGYNYRGKKLNYLGLEYPFPNCQYPIFKRELVLHFWGQHLIIMNLKPHNIYKLLFFKKISTSNSKKDEGLKTCFQSTTYMSCTLCINKS